MIYYIINEDEPKKEMILNINSFEKNSIIQLIYTKCINEKANERPSISELLFLLYANFYSVIDKSSIIVQFQEIQYFNGIINGQKEFIIKDIKKTMYYFSLIENLNFPKAFYNLAIICLEDKCVDINKVIHYLTLASNQNYDKASYLLGIMYYNNQNI